MKLKLKRKFKKEREIIKEKKKKKEKAERKNKENTAGRNQTGPAHILDRRAVGVDARSLRWWHSRVDSQHRAGNTGDQLTGVYPLRGPQGVTFGALGARQVVHPAAATCLVLSAHSGFLSFYFILYAFFGFRLIYRVFSAFRFSHGFPQFLEKRKFKKFFFHAKKYVLPREACICFSLRHKFVFARSTWCFHSCASSEGGA